jgi:hypothetical protein
MTMNFSFPENSPKFLRQQQQSQPVPALAAAAAAGMTLESRSALVASLLTGARRCQVHGNVIFGSKSDISKLFPLKLRG